MPEPRQFTTRLPEHVYKEMERLFEEPARHFRAAITNNEMIGALILRVRRDNFGLMDDLADYLDVRDAWRKDGSENLPKL
jgi:hypothetical protein